MPHPNTTPGSEPDGTQPLTSPVPVTAWRPTTADTTAGHFGTAVASRLIASYTRTNDLVLALDHPAATAEAASWLGRRATLIVTQGHHRDALAGVVESRVNPVRRAAIRILYQRPSELGDLLHSSAGQASLIIAGQAEGSQTGIFGEDPSQCMHACAAGLLRNGFLAIATSSVDESGQFTDRITTLIAAARAAGLHYHDHLIAINDHLSTQAGRCRPCLLQKAGSVNPFPRTHIDLLLFATPGATHA